MNKFNKLIAVTLLIGSAISAAAYAEAAPIFCAGDNLSQGLEGTCQEAESTWICIKS
ncbi:MAG: hypothetical protein G5703_12995 [Serratia symbiotica]|nr:hypothetical protein [Serratia symbiotica]